MNGGPVARNHLENAGLNVRFDCQYVDRRYPRVKLLPEDRESNRIKKLESTECCKRECPIMCRCHISGRLCGMRLLNVQAVEKTGICVNAQNRPLFSSRIASACSALITFSP